MCVFDVWFDLWMFDGMYWLLYELGQISLCDYILFFWEDVMLCEVCVVCVMNWCNWLQQLLMCIVCIVGNVIVDGCDVVGWLVVYLMLIVNEWCIGQCMFVGFVMYKFDMCGLDWKIYLKCVDFINLIDVFVNLEVFV